MRYIADLHIHSKYSRATSRDMDLKNLNHWARIKGINVLGTGDFTHPMWFSSIKKELIDLENGLFLYQESASQKEKRRVYFVLSSELSCIYKKNGKTRRIHLLILAPSLRAVAELNKRLVQRGFNLRSDGRPILGIDAKELMKLILEIDKKFLVIPAHIWTPWFSLYGSESGFDKMEECFEEYSDKIYAVETGLSSDPPMNWRVRDLEHKSILSNSDAHSYLNLGREATVFDFEVISYDKIYQAVRNKNRGLKYTIEFYPEEGKYHFDGHRSCGIRLSPEETEKIRGICPVCSKPLTIGVLNRSYQLAGYEAGYRPKTALDFKSLVGLDDVIAESLGCIGRRTKKVSSEYEKLIVQGGSEFGVLLDLDYKDLSAIANKKIVEAIKRNREGRLIIVPGYDGVFGTVKIFNQKEKFNSGQIKLL